MGSTPLGGCIGSVLKNLFSNFLLHIKDSKWGIKCIFMNCASCNGSPHKSHYGNSHLKMRQNYVTFADNSELVPVSCFGKNVERGSIDYISTFIGKDPKFLSFSTRQDKDKYFLLFLINTFFLNLVDAKGFSDIHWLL